MASHSGGGVDWAAILKPISSSNFTQLTQTDVLNLVKTILRSENEILAHDEVYELFFMSFSVLAANSFSGHCSSNYQSQMSQMIEASGVLIRYILAKLEKATNAEIKLLLPALKGLCTGRSQEEEFDQIILSSILRNAKFPENTKGNEKDSSKGEIKRSRSDLSTVILQQLTTPLGSTAAVCTWSPLSEELTDCTQIFTKANISLLEALNAGDIILKVCKELPSLAKYYSKYEEAINSNNGNTTTKNLYFPIVHSEALIIKKSFSQMSADMTILSMALSLPILDQLSPNKINQLSQCAMSALYVAVITSIATSVLNMTSSSSQKSSSNSVAAAAAASSVQGNNENEEQDDDPARTIVDKALEIFSTVGCIFNQTRSHIYQNHVCMGAWLLVSGIQGAMGASGSTGGGVTQLNRSAEEQTPVTMTTVAQQPPPPSQQSSSTIKGKSPSRSAVIVDPLLSSTGRVNLFKVQQGFGILNSAIANHSLMLITELIDDLKIESRSDDNLVNCDSVPEPAGFDILGQYTSLQRIVRVLNTTTMQQLLTFLATISYRKACTLKRVNIKNDGDPISYSDSTTYFNDTFSCSEVSESEDEEESYLGDWFKETLSPELKETPNTDQTGNDKSNEQQQRSGQTTMVPAKDEPHEYLELSAQIFTFLDNALGSNHKYLNRYVRTGLSEQQIVLLANILKDLDRDSVRSGEIDNTTNTQWQNAMVKFAGSIGRYLHNLISGGLINESLQSSLLWNLGVSPWAQDTNTWPLQVYSRTLSVLVQILLLKPSQEKEAACLSVWHRLVNTLVEGVCSTSSSGGTFNTLSTNTTSTSGASATNQPPPPPLQQQQSNNEQFDYEDLNVEHAQLLLFLFHSLNLMQKKSVLLLTAGGVIRCAEVCRQVVPEKPLREHQIILLSRLLLFLEYLMKHLYNAPTVLLEQVRWNLFSIVSLAESAAGQQKANDLQSYKSKLTVFCRKDLEDKYKKNSATESSVSTVRPKFYSLTTLDNATTINNKVQQEFKLDGLAWNFILCTPDKLKYPLLIDALIDILAVTDICMASSGKVPFQTICSVNYCFTLCWKLLLGLPPSTPHVEGLAQDKVPNLHMLVWAIRCLQPAASSSYLIINSLVKQGMYTQFAETLWNKITEHVSDIQYSTKQTILGLDSFNKTFQSHNPRLSKLILIDAIISHLYAIYWTDKHGVKSKNSSINSNNENNFAATATVSPSNDFSSTGGVGGGSNTDNINNTEISIQGQTNNSPPGSVTTADSSLTIASGSVTTITIPMSPSETIESPNSPNLRTSKKSNNELNRDLLSKLLDALEILKDCMFKTMSANLNGPIPESIMEPLLAISSSKCVPQFWSLLTGQDKEILQEWRKDSPNFPSNDETLSSTSCPIELHTLSVIDIHLSEICKQSNYSILLSLKHTLKSIVNLIYYLLPQIEYEPTGQTIELVAPAIVTDEQKLIERVKSVLVPLLSDIRTEYLYDETNKCMQDLLDERDINVPFMMTYSNVLRHSYRFLIDYCDYSSQGRNIGLDESILHNILKFWEDILDKPFGSKAIYDFFYVKKSGSLVQVLLSFTNTGLSQLYSTKVLQFFEKLIQTCDNPNSIFKLDEICVCFSELAHADNLKLKNWLSHILFGPAGAQNSAAVASTSAASSNVQTPTNMATVSAIPSISDQQSSDLLLDPNAMDIDYSCSVMRTDLCVASGGGGVGGGLITTQNEGVSSSIATGGGGGGNAGVGGVGQSSSGGVWHAGTTITTTNRSACTETPNDDDVGCCLAKNGRLLQSLTKYIVSESRISSNVAPALFQALIQLGQNLLYPNTQDSMEFTEMLQVMITLADAGQGKGHSTLFTSAIDWLDISKTIVLERVSGLSTTTVSSSTPAASTTEKPLIPFENVSALLRYMCDVLRGLGFTGGSPIGPPPWEEDQPTEFDDIVDEMAGDDDDSTVEDSDEDSLGSKLCTYSVTQKEFMNQHWYHCYTCKMVDGVGVCSVCARVCHKNHDISYAKYGNFFCDCGAKDDGSCQALNRRTSTVGGSSTTIIGATYPSSGGAIVSTAQQSIITTTTTNNNSTEFTMDGSTDNGVVRKRSVSPPTGSTTNVLSSANGGITMKTIENAIQMAKMIGVSKDQLKNNEQWHSVIGMILEFFENLMPTIKENRARYSTIGCHLRARNALERLHQPDKRFSVSDQLMLATLGSQEGAFENVRSTYAGDQAQTIRQLIATNMVRRVGLCCLSSPHGKRQHLAVSHEKGKVTILQLSALLKQADAAKKKLTLSRLSSAPVPCTIMSLSSNPVNEDLLAVCGLKECHILTFSSNGTVNQHIVITPQLETGNFIKRAIWLPGSQSMLAIITCDYVKIYELAEDTFSPQYYFVVPSGKIRDCTFVYQSGTYYLLLFASSGYIYTQPLVDESLAKHGAFYVTNTLEIDHPQVFETKSALGEGGASIYYSHLLQMLFFSYSIGKSFMAPLIDVNAGVKCVILLQTGGNSNTNGGASGGASTTTAAAGSSKNSSSSSSKVASQALMQWTEVPGHPGLIFAMQHQSNNPVVFMIRPDAVLVQEIKYNNAKSKIMDMVAIRHTTAGQERTTLLLLCEDGSLRIFAANAELTGYWLSSEVQPLSANNALYQSFNPKSSMKKLKRGQKSSSGNSLGATQKPGGQSSSMNGNANGIGGPISTIQSFPIDFFEHCTYLTDIEYGGNDLLQIYNTQQLKHRLNSTGLYVASTKPSGFTLEITNSDANIVLCGVRVLVGTQEMARAPQTITILGRTVNLIATRPRWFDVPLTREESLQSDKKLNLVFGSSLDPENISMLDSVKVYGKTKEVFGWPEEIEEIQNIASASSINGNNNNGGGSIVTNGIAGSSATGTTSGGVPITNNTNVTSLISPIDSSIPVITPFVKMITAMLKVLDCGLALLGGPAVDESTKKKSMEVATMMLLYPLPTVVQNQSKWVLATLVGTRNAYNNYIDKEILSDINTELNKLKTVRDVKKIDPEAFFRLVILTRGIAVARPQSLTKISNENQYEILASLMQLLHELYEVTPKYELQSSIVKIGLSHTEATVHCLVEIIYAFALSDDASIGIMTKYLVELLLDKSAVISHSAKHAMIRLLRPRVKKRTTPVGGGSSTVIGGTQNSLIKSTIAVTKTTTTNPATVQQALPSGSANDEYVGQADGIQDLDQYEAASENESGEGAAAAASVGGNNSSGNNIAGDAEAFPHLVEQDDEEAIMEIAIALSLQDQESDLQVVQEGLANLQDIHNSLQALGAAANANSNSNDVIEPAAASTTASNFQNESTISDDEGSNAATDGSTLRTSPAEPAGSGGSESGGSGVESIGGASGRSSTYDGDQSVVLAATANNIGLTTNSQQEPLTNIKTTTSNKQEEQDDSIESENITKLHGLRTMILLKMVENIKTLELISGHQAIPFMQVLLMLTSDLDGNLESDKLIMNRVLSALIDRLEVNQVTNVEQMQYRTAKTEVQFVILRFLSVLMGKIASSSSSSTSSSKSTTTMTTTATSSRTTKDNATFVGTATADALMENSIIPYCLEILKSFLPYWVNVAQNETNSSGGSGGGISGGGTHSSVVSPSSGVSITNQAVITSVNGTPATNHLLKLNQNGPELDLHPFFGPTGSSASTTNMSSSKQLPSDAFEQYQNNITEIAVRLPYQILKLSTENPSQFEWFSNFYENLSCTLCEYMMAVQSPNLRRIIRKLLLFVCGSKERFRQTRDIHWLDTHISMIKKYSEPVESSAGGASGGLVAPLSYDALVELTEHLRSCQEIASVRTGNWQRFCLRNTDVLPSLMRLSTNQLTEGVSPVILKLLQAAICSSNPIASVVANSGGAAAVTTSSTTISIDKESKSNTVKSRQDRDKSEDTDNFPDSNVDATQYPVLVFQIFSQLQPQFFTKFIKIFLLETNITSIRWQAHDLIYSFYENSYGQQKERLLNCMWELWPLLPAYGRRTAQFVDLLGYFTLNTKQIINRLPEYMEMAVSVLRLQNERLAKHPNAPIYTQLGQVLELEGYYLESEPCLVCNNPEVPMSNIKLSSIKIDSKYTTTTTIVKLSQSHTIYKIVLRIADLKRTKMVRTINIYYNNRTVQAVVELKNRPSMWHKARKVTLQSGQTDVKIEFPLPITACNLMIEYADFYETVTGSSENLQCPRCSAAVPANPGVCGNCGENVFQCHKCRAINYDEKDPFLCHSCGFCKYAKFDYNIFGRACCAVDPIESADDRAKTVQTIHSSLEKADRVYRSLQSNKQILELLVQKISEQKLDRCSSGGGNNYNGSLEETVIVGTLTSQVNKVIQLLAQKYCIESKTSFEELSKIIQKVQACRRELVAYDRSEIDLPTSSSSLDSIDTSSSSAAGGGVAHNRCYGCALASTEQCLTLLRAMASNVDCRIGLCKQGLVEELAQNNLRRGTYQIQDEVRQLLCLLTRDLPEETRGICNLILTRVKLALSGIVPLSNIDSAVRHEMALLESLVSMYDSCWEQKLKVVLEIFLLACRDTRGLPVAVLQPSLRILESLICPPAAKSKTNKDLSTQSLYTVKSVGGLTVDYREWLNGNPIHSFDAWRSRMPKVPTTAEEEATVQTASAINDKESQQATINNCDAVSSGSTTTTTTTKVPRIFSSVLEQKRAKLRSRYLTEKYGHRWRNKVLAKGIQHLPLKLTASWLHPILFVSNSRIGRQLATALIPTLINKDHERKREILDLLTDFLKYIGDAGEASEEFLLLYRCLSEDTPWRQYLVLKKGVIFLITDLLAIEIEKIHRLEETTLSSDLAQGYALRQLVELLAMFLENPKIRQVFKGRLLGPVLQSYLSLRKLVVQRTRLVDDAQEKLLEMLEEMTTGTEEETRAFMSVLIDTVCKTPMNDIKTPVFIFERLCSIIHPEENDVGEFFLTLEKDAQQEDFLQGRMLGNPYPSSEAGLGPLMRDVKNKICMDCELVALLEDDNGMELLVYNKIISLDLPVKDVYKKVWLAEGGERDTMRIVYRMRGLLGDATEEFVETLNNKSTEEVDNEQLYRMANVLADECNGLKVMLDRIASLQNVSRSRSLLQVLLKLFLLAVKVRRCQEVLCQPELGAINTLLKVLQLCLQSENDSQQSAVTEQLLEIMETILSKASSDTLDSFLQFSLTFGGPEYVTALISCTNCSNVRNNPSVLRHLIRVLAALVYGNDLKMALLCEHFKDTLYFNKFDAEHTAEDEFKMELFCVLTNQIEHNAIGGTLKDYIMGLGIVEKALAYTTTHAPCVKPTLVRTDSDELKEFISKPSLKYILRFLTGLTTKHEPTQLAIAKDIIPIIHRLEQVSSDEHVGSLAENLLEALCTDPITSKRVQEVRDFTRAEKKRLAMATREKQLDALGMRTNDKGQVTAKGSILQKIEKLRDETGLTCFICREGYACQPSKVLGIYTFTKRINVEEYETKARKTLGYTTVTHFNVVHIDCHMSAIRLARGRDEWESASLQNANTRCNGLLPLFGPDVLESAFASCMTRHNANMMESTQRCEITFNSAIHDLKLLLLRFAQEKSFHEDAGGGGPQSNMHLVPYLLFYALYIMLSTRSFTREEKTLSTYLQQPISERWLECAYEVEGPFYQLTLSLALHTPAVWRSNRLAHLKRLIAMAHIRHLNPSTVTKTVADSSPLDYSVYKPVLMMWALIDNVYVQLFKTATTPKEEDWPISLFDYIRRNDEAMLKSSDIILSTFTDEFLPCTSFAEFCDVSGLLIEIDDPQNWLIELLDSLPSTPPASTA